jgi:hypothetical protein
MVDSVQWGAGVWLGQAGLPSCQLLLPIPFTFLQSPRHSAHLSRSAQPPLPAPPTAPAPPPLPPAGELEQHSGAILADCKVATPSKAAQDMDSAKALWGKTEEMLAAALTKAGIAAT